MHLTTNQGSLDCGESNEVDRDAPSSTDSDDGVERNGFHEESDSADNELSDDEAEPPYNVEAFFNPVFNIADLNIDPHTDDEQPSEGHDYYFMIEHNFEDISSSSELSDETQEDQQEIVEPENEQRETSKNPEGDNLNGTQLNSESKDDLKNAQPSETNNTENSSTNDINPNSFNYDHSEYIMVDCDDERIEPIAITTPCFGTFYSPNIHGPHNSDYPLFNYHGSNNSGYPSTYPPYAPVDAGNIQRSRYFTPPLFNTTFSSQHHAASNPGYATLHLLPILRYNFHNNPRLPTSHYHFQGHDPRPCSTIFTTTNHRTNPLCYSTNYNAPDHTGYTGPRWINNHGYVPPSPRYDPSRNNGYLSSSGHSSFVPPAYLDPRFYGYGNPYSPYYAPAYSSGSTYYPQYSVPYSDYSAPQYLDTQDLSENVASQSPVTQVLSNDEASGASASNNYGSAGTSGYSGPSSGCPDTLDVSKNVASQSPLIQVLSNDDASGSTASNNDETSSSTTAYNVEASGSTASYNYDGLSTSGYTAPVAPRYGLPGWFFFYSGYGNPDFTIHSGPDSISNGSLNSTGNDASSMSGDAEPGPSGEQREKRSPFNSDSQSRSLPNSTRRHDRNRGDTHRQ